MKKYIQRLSFALALLVCLNGLLFGVAEDAPSGDALIAETPEVSQSPEAAPEATAEPETFEAPEITPNTEIPAAPTPETTIASPEPTPETTPEASIAQTEVPETEMPAEPTPETTPDASIAPTEVPEESEIPAESTPEPETYICNLEAHTHSEECYDEQQNLICTKPEHVHDDSCKPVVEETPVPTEIEDQAAVDIETVGELVLADYIDPALWKGVRPSDERGMAIPMLFQTDYTEIVCTLNGLNRSVATSGCGATSLSMVIAYLTGNTDQNPYELFRDSVKNGYYHGAGWSHKTLSRYADAYGIHSAWISNDAETILNALQSGYPVIAHMGKGIFTEKGHYLVLRGLTEDGLVLVNDPNSRENCELAFPIGTLLKQAKTSESFMVCWNDDMEAFKVPEKEAEAEETVSIVGDFNNSGSVDINDLQLMYDCLQSGETDESFDLNGDGIVDSLDTDALLSAILNEGGESV